MAPLRVLISGASVAGPATAYWFARLTDASITVVERFPSLRTNGQNVDIRTVGVTIMRRMPGMEKAVRASTMAAEGMCMVRENGTPIAVMRATGDPDQQSLMSEYEILRGDLSKIIYGLTKDEKRIKYVFGEQITSITQKDDEEGNPPAVVEFANGLPTGEYDLVVACDGSTSRTRSLGLGCGLREYTHSQNVWGAYFSIKEDLLKGSKISQGFTAPGGRFLSMDPYDNPASGNQVMLMGVRPRQEENAMIPFREAAKQGDNAVKKYIASFFKGIGWKTDEIIDGMMSSNDFYASEIMQIKLPAIQKGRFALVGDAGYAPGFTGTGTSLALAGAYILAGEVGRCKGDLKVGLQRYENRMRPILKDLQKVPPGVPGLLAPQTAWGIWLRNLGYRIVAAAIEFKGAFSWLGKLLTFWSGAFGGDNFGIPDYEREASHGDHEHMD